MLMFRLHLEVPDELEDAKKYIIPLKICMQIEHRDSISFIFDKERKSEDSENLIQEDDWG